MSVGEVTSIGSKAELESAVGEGGATFAYFCEPSKPVDVVFAQLAVDNPHAKFFKVEAKEQPEIAKGYGVSTVPFFLFFKDGAVVDKLEDANAPELANKVLKIAGSLPSYSATKKLPGRIGLSAGPMALEAGQKALPSYSATKKLPGRIGLSGGPMALEAGQKAHTANGNVKYREEGTSERSNGEAKEEQAGQAEQGHFDLLQARESFEIENQDAPLLSTNARAEDYKNEEGGAHMAKKKGEIIAIKSEDGEKPLLHLKSRTSEDETSHAEGRVIHSILGPTKEESITPELIQEMEIKYAAFVRDDIYGTFGRAELPVMEKILVALALVTIVPIRVFLLLLVLITYYCICKICTVFRRPGEEEGQENYGYLTGVRRHVIVFTGRWLARTLLFVLGFYWIKVTHGTPDLMMQRLRLGPGQEEEDNERLLEVSKGYPGAIVSNHISYVDILYHMSASFPSFVAKKSVAKLPLVGLMSKCMGCVYVQRESKSPNFKGVSGIITERVQAAHASLTSPIFLLFPEGTTSNGEYLLPFKTGAFLAGTPVLPVILKYPYGRFSPAWETMTGVRHIILLLCQLVNYLEVTRLPVYYPSAKECSDPKTYANNVRTLMSIKGDLTKSDIGLYEKRVYHAALAGKALPNNPHKKLD